jgi:hypothetical protein
MRWRALRRFGKSGERSRNDHRAKATRRRSTRAFLLGFDEPLSGIAS